MYFNVSPDINEEGISGVRCEVEVEVSPSLIFKSQSYLKMSNSASVLEKAD